MNRLLIYLLKVIARELLLISLSSLCKLLRQTARYLDTWLEYRKFKASTILSDDFINNSLRGIETCSRGEAWLILVIKLE